VFKSQPLVVVFIKFQYLYPLNLRVPGEIVFFNTCVNTSSAADTPGKVQGISIDNIVHGRSSFYCYIFAGFESQLFG
jgi:hypothetical protein